jgi:hypothetical protein
MFPKRFVTLSAGICLGYFHSKYIQVIAHTTTGVMTKPGAYCKESYRPGAGSPPLRFIPYSIFTVNNFLLLSLPSQERRLSPTQPLSTTYISKQSYRTSRSNNRVVVLPLILTVLNITKNSYRYAQCSTLTIRIYSDIVSTKLDGWKAVSCHTLTENVGHLPADCVNPRTAK